MECGNDTVITGMNARMVTCIRPGKNQGSQNCSMGEEGFTRPKLEEGRLTFPQECGD